MSTTEHLAHLRSLARAEEVSKRPGKVVVYKRSAEIIAELQDRVDHLMPIAEWVTYMSRSLCLVHQIPTPTCLICKHAFDEMERAIRSARLNEV